MIIVLSALAFAAGACGEASDTRTNPEGQWEFVSGTGPDGEIENVEGYRTTLALEDGQAGGILACNAFGLDSVRITGDRIVFGEFAGTAVDCDEDVVPFADAYQQALTSVTQVKRTGDRLVLTGPSIELVYTEFDPVTLDDLTGRTWTLQGFSDADGEHDAVGDATVRFGESGRIDGTTGCRPFDMVVAVRPGYGLQVTRGGGMPSSALDECAEEADQEAAIARIFGAMGTQLELDGDRLTLSGQRGYELVYESD